MLQYRFIAQTKILLICVLVFSDGIFLDDVIEWNIFKHKYSKSYKTFEEDVHHMTNFIEHKHKIDAHNQQYENGIVSFRMGLNKYSDLSHSEFVSQMNGYKNFHGKNEHEIKEQGIDFDTASSYVKLPASIDWREKGAVTFVKDQGGCGSCYSFSATGAIEGHYFIKTGRLVSLSEQDIIDCSRQFANNGCDGGLTTNAFNYIKQNGGISTEDAYPYSGQEMGYCRNHSYNRSVVKVNGYVAIPSGDEEKLKEAIARGPVSVSIDASQPTIHSYRSGIYYDHHCRSTRTDHAVLVVGYGTDEHERDYYIIKNSWGSSWGENGYFRLARNHHNHCGIALRASYPLVYW